jgi:dihydroxyacetone kinase, phosphoprotein-dependent, L subunit
MKFTPSQYVSYIVKVAEYISKNGEYITELDAATGDGDHWLNINIGYQKIREISDELKLLDSFQILFNRLAKLIMSSMGGTSGALYGGAYMASAKLLGDIKNIDANQLADMLYCWEVTIMRMGNTEVGFKTMIDTLHPAVVQYREALDSDKKIKDALLIMKAAAWDGANSTKDMEAFRGRASNQPGKGVGHLDPGAVTMAMQLECLVDYLVENCI